MSKKLLTVVLSLTLTGVTLFSNGVQSFASTTHKTYSTTQIEQKQKDLNKKISKILDKNYNNIKLENSTLKLDTNYIKNNNIDINSKEFENEVINEVTAYGNKYSSSTVNSSTTINSTTNSNPLFSILSATGTFTRTASVGCSVPALGWGYIKQDYRSTIVDNAYQSVEFLGDSYKTGFTFGSWTPIRSWYEIGGYQTYAKIYIKGTMDYSLKLGLLSSAQTFQYIDGVTDYPQ